MTNQEKIDHLCNYLINYANHDYGYYGPLHIEETISSIVNNNLDYLLTTGFIHSMTSLYSPIKWKRVLMGLLDDTTRMILVKESFDYLIIEDDLYEYRNKYENDVYAVYCKYLQSTFKDRMVLNDEDVEFASEILEVVATYIIVNNKDISCFNDYANKLYYELDDLMDSLKLQGIEFMDTLFIGAFLDTDNSFQKLYTHFIAYIIGKIEEDKKTEIR